MAKFVPLKFWVTLAVYLALGLLPLVELGILWSSERIPLIGPQLEGAATTRVVASLVSGLIALTLVSQGWRAVWKLPVLGPKLSKALFYDLNGEWTAELQSNWSIVERMQKAAQSTDLVFDVLDDADLPDLLDVSFDVRIRQSWFRTDVEFLPTDNSTLATSKTLSVELFKAENGSKSMAWVFEAQNKRNNQSKLTVTDERGYLGAARLNLSEDGLELSGEFWQNRAWHRGLNAAGQIVLRKKSS